MSEDPEPRTAILGRPHPRGGGGCRPGRGAPHRRHARHGPRGFKNGDPLPPHWFTLFFADAPRQSRYRPRRPSEARRGAAADPAAAPHGRRAPGDDPRQPARRRRRQQDGRGRRHRAEAGAHRLHHRADHAPHHPPRGPGDRGGRVRRHLPGSGEAGREERHGRAGTGAERPRLGHDQAPDRAAGLPLFRHHLERPPHPLRRRLLAAGGRLSRTPCRMAG